MKLGNSQGNPGFSDFVKQKYVSYARDRLRSVFLIDVHLKERKPGTTRRIKNQIKRENPKVYKELYW